MYLIEKKKQTKNKKQLLNNLNDFIIQIEYFDQKGIKKRNHRIPLKYIVNSKFINAQSSI